MITRATLAVRGKLRRQSAEQAGATRPAGSRRTRQLLSESATAFAIKIVSAGLQLAMFVALARSMKPSEYGIFGSAFSLVTLLAVLGSYGQRSLSLRFAAAYDEMGHPELVRGVLRDSYRLVVTGCAACSVFVLAYSLLNHQTSAWWIVGVSAMTLTTGIIEYQAIAFRAMASVWLTLLPRDVFHRSAILLGAMSAALIGGRDAIGALGWVWIFAASTLVTAVVQLLLYERGQNRTIFRGQAEYAREEWRTPARGLWATSVITTAVPSLSVVLIGHDLGPAPSGTFFSALRVAQLLNILLLATNVICTPLLSRALAVNDTERAQGVASLTASLGGGFGAAFYLIFIFLGHPILRLFGSDFASGYPTLLILAFGFTFNTVAGPTGPLLEMSGNQRAYTAILLIFNLLAIGAMPIAISIAGATGAASCVAFGAVGWNTAAWIYCRRRVGVDPTLFAALLNRRHHKSVAPATTKG